MCATVARGNGADFHTLTTRHVGPNSPPRLDRLSASARASLPQVRERYNVAWHGPSLHAYAREQTEIHNRYRVFEGACGFNRRCGFSPTERLPGSSGLLPWNMHAAPPRRAVLCAS